MGFIAITNAEGNDDVFSEVVSPLTMKELSGTSGLGA
jgi:hypothetical protein